MSRAWCIRRVGDVSGYCVCAEQYVDSLLAPDLFIAIGGGGFIPARILRTFCKNIENGTKRNIPIQAVGLYLYESMGGVSPSSWRSC